VSAPLETAAALLSARSSRPVRLESPALLKSWTRNDVWRARVAGGPDLPESVIVKRFKSEPERGLDEWAALALLTTAGIAPAVAPGFLGGDAEARCFLVEDLGVAPTLEELLNAADADAREHAESALLDVARLTARLHVAMRPLAAEFDRQRDALARRAMTTAAAAAMALRGRGSDLAAWLSALREPVAALPDEAMDELAQFVERPGEWTTLTHGDMAPSNTGQTASGWRLLDFEYAGVRPALYDALVWTLFCPFPPGLIERADRVYRETMAAGFPAARDDAAYATARARVAAWRMLDLLHWQTPALLEADREWAPGVGARGAVLWHLARFHALAGAASRDTVVPMIAATTLALERALRARWGGPPDPGAVWPAFRADRL
jgi:thiamine kinase-like enzyme